MPKSHIVAATALGIALALACTPPEERAERAREAVRQAVVQGDRGAALEALDDLRAVAPDTPDSLLELAQLLVQVGSAPDAGWLLEEGVRRFPERDDLRLALARVALLLGNPSLAREAVAPVAVDSEQHALALVTRAQAELNLGDLEGALETLAEAERLYPDRPEARLVRISTLLSERRQEEARAAIEEARAALAGEEEEQAGIRHRLDVTLAQIQAQRGEAEAGIATLTAMVEANPADLLAWHALIQILVRQERSEECLALLEGALQADEPPLDLLPPGGAGSRLAREPGRSRGSAPYLRGALGVGSRVSPSGEPSLRPGRRRGHDARTRRGARSLPG